MKIINFFIIALFLFSTLNYSQEKPQGKKITVSGKVVSKNSNQPLEYTSISLLNIKSNKVTAGGITNEKGEFNFVASPGNYNIKIDFISFKLLEINNKSITENINLGTILLEEDSKQIEEVVVFSYGFIIDF